jgi:hypothetical protein
MYPELSFDDVYFCKGCGTLHVFAACPTALWDCTSLCCTSLYPRQHLRTSGHCSVLFGVLQCFVSSVTSLCLPSTLLLHCTVLHCAVLYSTTLYCTLLYCTVLHCTTLYCTVLHCTALHCTALYCTAYLAVPHYNALYYRRLHELTPGVDWAVAWTDRPITQPSLNISASPSVPGVRAAVSYNVLYRAAPHFHCSICTAL